MDRLSDTALVKKYQRGDVAAFAVFTERHRDRLFRQAVVWIGEVAMAQDAVQETFFRSYHGLGRFRFAAEPGTWMARVCRNVCYELVRKRGMVVDDLSSTENAVAPAANGSAVPIPAYLHKVLRQLPQRQREVTVLRLLEDYSVRETAKILGCREGTVKAHLAKALVNLRQFLGGELADYLDEQAQQTGDLDD